MPDLINLLPDFIANQIAAGEVIQRPASAVKELMENAVDSGAGEIKLFVKDAGKTLIQVTDNGCGMSERDARMCFERHATSKIRKADDLMAIRTLGFRGEALASIASVAQVTIKSKRTEDEPGTSVEIEGTEFKGQYPVNCPNGTSVSVKNLFFNVPARRNFLKSNQLELKYIIEEFIRVALARPSIAFVFHNQERLMYQIPASILRQRIVGLFGNTYSERLVPVEQKSGIVNISGFIGKPEFSKKTRGEQYFFTNNRFIKNPYLHHAVETAFSGLIPKDSFPSYFLFLEADPATIDVNIHPTKTEVNFQDSRSVYAILHAAVRQSIGRHTLAPSLDFETEQGFRIPPLPEGSAVKPPTVTINPDYNPFEKKTRPQMEIPLPVRSAETRAQLDRLLEPLKNIDFEKPGPAVEKIFQLQDRFIVTHIKSGIVIIDQQNAHERILYERFFETGNGKHTGIQKQLIPQQVHIHPADAGIIQEYMGLLKETGFEIGEFGKDTLVIHSIPSGLPNDDIPSLFEKMIESLRIHPEKAEHERRSVLARTMARAGAVKKGRRMMKEEMSAMAEQLFACKAPEITPDGKPTMILMGYDDLVKKFK